MTNGIRKIDFLVTPSAKADDGHGTKTPLPEQKPVTPPVKPVALQKLQTNANLSANVHLVIERDENSGGYIYKSVDRRTGKVLQQFPREEVLRAIAAERAAEGLVIDTKA